MWPSVVGERNDGDMSCKQLRLDVMHCVPWTMQPDSSCPRKRGPAASWQTLPESVDNEGGAQTGEKSANAAARRVPQACCAGTSWPLSGSLAWLHLLPGTSAYKPFECWSEANTWQQSIVVLHVHNDNIGVRGTLARGHLQRSR